jgi:hypothetical protein
MTELRTAHTADLGAGQLAAIRRLMDAAFDGVSDDTYDNVLGGVHALVLEDGELIGHGSHDELLERSGLYREIVEKGLPDQVFLQRDPAERPDRDVRVAGL